MRTACQEYKEATYEEALMIGCDCFQLKYDGWWSRTEVVARDGRLFTKSNRELQDFYFPTGGGAPGTFIGEVMYGTHWAQDATLRGKVFLFDMWRLGDQDLEALPYRERYSLMKKTQALLPSNYLRVTNYPMNEFPTVWDKLVVNGNFEGVVFRKKEDQVGRPLYRLKKEVTDEYECTGFVEGEGKYIGTLGALQFRTPTMGATSNPPTVGGGFSDAERDEIWANRPNYKGRMFEVVGKQRFETTGLLRHPNFVRWKEDQSESVPTS